MNSTPIHLRITNLRPRFSPGEVLECEYSIAQGDEPIQSVETSVIWITEGKGEEDLGVHFFDRRRKSQARDGDLQALYRFRTVLPHSPLSYEGQLIKIRWCIRVRIFLGRGREQRFDTPFRLGHARMISTGAGDDETIQPGLAS
jgi:hypothetical protein